MSQQVIKSKYTIFEAVVRSLCDTILGAGLYLMHDVGTGFDIEHYGTPEQVSKLKQELEIRGIQYTLTEECIKAVF